MLWRNLQAWWEGRSPQLLRPVLEWLLRYPLLAACADLRVGKALRFRLPEGGILDQASLAFIPLAGPAESDDHSR